MKKTINKILQISLVALIFAFVLWILSPNITATESPKYAYVSLEEPMGLDPMPGISYFDNNITYLLLSYGAEYRLMFSLTTNIKDYNEFDVRYGLNIVDQLSESPEIASYSTMENATSTFYMQVKYFSSDEVVDDKDRKINYNGKLYIHRYIVEFNENTYNKMNIQFGSEFNKRLFVSKLSATIKPGYIIDDKSIIKNKYYRFSSIPNIDKDLAIENDLKPLTTNRITSIKSDKINTSVIVSEKLNKDEIDSLRKNTTKDAFIEEIDKESILISENNATTQDVYIVGKNGTNKIKDISIVLSEQKINPNKIIDSVQLVNINDTPKYVFSVKETKKLFGFIPIGNKVVIKSIDATENLESQ